MRTPSEAGNVTASPGTGVGDGLPALDGVAVGSRLGPSPVAPPHDTRATHAVATINGDRVRRAPAACTGQL